MYQGQGMYIKIQQQILQFTQALVCTRLFKGKRCVGLVAPSFMQSRLS